VADLSDVAIVLLAIAVGTGFAAVVHFLADRMERRKWRAARKHLPFITE
jgi:hypothetical protein